ncbi:MAG: hypothetical protein AAF628_05540 [Planctomycetota bacterium]
MRPSGLLLCGIVAACAAPEPEARSLSGAPLTPAPIPEEVRLQREAELSDAEQRWRAAPDDLDAIIWLGRRQAYLGRYRQAVATFTRGLERHPEAPRLLRHRGHRWITLRRFDDAIADLERAAQLVAGQADRVEADGLPNARGIPTSTLQTNIWYHLGLARYLSGDLAGAAMAYARCREVASNPDMTSAALYWCVLIAERRGRGQEAREWLAAVTPDWDIIENHGYHQLLLLFKGVRQRDDLVRAFGDGASDSIESATVAYGLALYDRFAGRGPAARHAMERILAGSQWAAFGYIAAEAELHGSLAVTAE